MTRQTTGKLGEKLTREFLQKRGYRIIETNYRCPGGEIDIIAQHQDYLVFIEVRTKTGTGFGSPEESVTQVKKERLKTLALQYCQTHENLPALWRIDFVAVELSPARKVLRLEVIENAVTDE